MTKIRKAVFPVAGMGTRFLPATKASPKEMLPVVDKPLIQYAAEEAVVAGINTLVFITGRHKRSIEDHFDKACGCLAQMVDVYDKEQCGVVGVQEVDKKDVKSYGVISGKQVKDNMWDVDTFVEKPDPKDAPSNVAVVGRYLLEPSIFDILEQTEEGAGGEIQLTDALATQAKFEKLLAYKFDGKRYDCGSKLGYLEATVELAMKHPSVGRRFSDYISQLNK